MRIFIQVDNDYVITTEDNNSSFQRTSYNSRGEEVFTTIVSADSLRGIFSNLLAPYEHKDEQEKRMPEVMRRVVRILRLLCGAKADGVIHCRIDVNKDCAIFFKHGIFMFRKVFSMDGIESFSFITSTYTLMGMIALLLCTKNETLNSYATKKELFELMIILVDLMEYGCASNYTV